ncbi:MAG: HEAT repeat domain-containing protein [Myxococcales bacterium]|nr:HEAT repeat domain-containing protein [Myxococcales bacterium]
MSSWALLWNDPLYRLVIAVCAAQILLLCALIGVIASIRAARTRLGTVSERASAAISEGLFEYLAGVRRVDELVADTRQFSVHQLAVVVERYLPTLAGRDLEAVAHFAERAGLVEAGRRLCRSVFWWRRLEGARILGAGCGRAGAELLLRLLDDPNLSVRLAAARALGRTQDPVHIEPLLRTLRRGRLARPQIAEVLVELGAESRQRLRELVMQLPADHRSATLRATTIEVLALVGDAGATPFIQFALTAVEPDVRVAAFKAAAIIRAGLSRDEVRAGLRDDVWAVRAHAVKLVGRNQITALAREVSGLLTDTSWWVRVNAARALYELGPPGVELLELAGATHTDEYARGIALRVLTEDPAYSAIAELRERLATPVRVGAATGA